MKTSIVKIILLILFCWAAKSQAKNHAAIFEKTAPKNFAYTDHLNSITTLTNDQGTITATQSFDAWGNKRNPNTWQNTNIPGTPAWLTRGYTGHEHLPQFALINMNGRMYDPQNGRMLSPDKYLQAPNYTQSYNRYSYCMNNPMKFTDPSGDMFGPLLTAIWDLGATIFTKGGLDPSNSSSNRRAAWRDFDPTRAGSKTNNSLRITAGLYAWDDSYSGKGDVWRDAFEVYSRLTWQLPQTIIGNWYANARNIVGRTERVEFFHGDTISVKKPGQGSLAGGSVTLGSYITLANVADDQKAKIETTEFGYTTMHEYGHYLQSQKSGTLYLLKYGAPSAAGADWTEWDANQRAANYFQDKFPWVSSANTYRFLPGYTTNPRWFEYPLAIFPIGIYLIMSNNRTNPW